MTFDLVQFWLLLNLGPVTKLLFISLFIYLSIYPSAGLTPSAELCAELELTTL